VFLLIDRKALAKCSADAPPALHHVPHVGKV